jgi:hypothetical protein
MNREDFSGGLVFLVFGAIFFSAHMNGERILDAFFRFWPLILVIHGLVIIFLKEKRREHGPPDHYQAGLALITIGAFFLLVMNGFTIGLLSLPFVFPGLMMFFGFLKLMVGVFDLPGHRILGLVIFIWLVATFFAYLPYLSFSQTIITGMGGDYGQNFNLSSITSARINIDLGELTLNRGDGNVSARFSGTQPSATLTGNSFSFDADMSEATILMEREYGSSTLESHVGLGDLNILSLMGFSDLNLDVGMGSINVVVDQVEGNVNVEVGTGSISINVPEGTEYQITYSVGLGSFSGRESCSFSCSGTYKTDGYETADKRMNIMVNTGLGSISIIAS